MSFNVLREKKFSRKFPNLQYVDYQGHSKYKIPITTNMMKLMCSLKAVHLCLYPLCVFKCDIQDNGLFFEQMITQRYPAGATKS